jgi:hypothetical protein
VKERKDPTVTRRDDLIKAFITPSDMGMVDEIPRCFGGLPEGNETAHSKGCMECPLYTHSSACSDATQVCRKIYWRDATFVLTTTNNHCDWCQGAGYLSVIAGTGGTRKCHVCAGKGADIKYTMEEVKC